MQKTLEQRERAAREREEQQRAWEEAKIRARQLYITDHNRRRLEDQLARYERSVALRRYAAQIDQVASETDDSDQARRTGEWAAWTRDEADAADPLLQPADLAFEEPVEVTDEDVEPFMPRGMSARHPRGRWDR